MQNSSFIAGFNKISELVIRFVGTNLLWFIFNIPIVFFGFSLFAMENANEMFTILITIAFLAPFFLFPASAAMFGVLRKFIMGEEIPIIRNFLKYYKENYLKSMIGGIFITFLWAILAYYYLMLSNSNTLLTVIFVILGFFLFVFMLNFLSVIVHMEIKLIAALKSAFLITVGAPLLTIGIAVISAIILYVSFNIFTFLIPFLVGSIIAHLSFSGYYKVMISFQILQEKQEEEKNYKEEPK